MSRRFYEPVSGDLQLFSQAETIFVEAELQEDLLILNELRALSEETRTELAIQQGKSLEAYDETLDLEYERTSDILDFYGYDNTTLNITVKDGTWFTPEAIEDVCGEDAGHEAVLTIDGLNATYWEHDVTEDHQITWRLRDYKKRFPKLRVRVGSGLRTKLTGVDIYVANTVAGLDKPENLVATGVALIGDNVWQEIDLGGDQNARYIRFTGFRSQNANDYVRLHEIAVWVITKDWG